MLLRGFRTIIGVFRLWRVESCLGGTWWRGSDGFQSKRSAVCAPIGASASPLLQRFEEYQLDPKHEVKPPFVSWANFFLDLFGSHGGPDRQSVVKTLSICSHICDGTREISTIADNCRQGKYVVLGIVDGTFQRCL